MKPSCELPKGKDLDDSDESQAEHEHVGIHDHDHVRRLVEAARTDREAIAQLYRIHYRVIAAYVHRRVTSFEDANDVVSEVFTAMVVGLPSYRWRGVPFCIWLYRIATNKISRWARQRRTNLVDQVEQLQAKTPGLTEDIDSEWMALALATLPIKFQDVLTLHYLEGLSIAEIAAVLKRSEGTIKSRLHTGRGLMRQQLEKRGMKIE